MIIRKNESIEYNWDNVKSWNYKLPHLNPKMSVVYAEVSGEHGEVTTGNSEWIYYIIDGEGEFIYNENKYSVKKGDVFTVPARTKYNYFGSSTNPLKVVMYIDYWDN